MIGRLAGLILLLATINLAVGSCSTKEDLAAAEREVEKFHQAYNAGRFDEIYEKTTDELKKNASQEDFAAMLETVQRKLGKVTEAKRENWTVNFRRRRLDGEAELRDVVRPGQRDGNVQLSDLRQEGLADRIQRHLEEPRSTLERALAGRECRQPIAECGDELGDGLGWRTVAGNQLVIRVHLEESDGICRE
jgi:hypothetical protein